MNPIRRHARTLTAAVGLASLYALTWFSPLARGVDQWAFAGRLDAGMSLLTVDRIVLSSISRLSVSLAILLLAATAYRRFGGSASLRVAGSVVLAALSAELLKAVLPAVPRPGSNSETLGGSFPSGHTAIATAVALGALTVLGPRSARVLKGPLVAWVTVAAAATVAIGWHRPSDAIGGVLLAVAWHVGLVRARSEVTSTRTTQAQVLALRGLRVRSAALLWWASAAAVVLFGALAPSGSREPSVGEPSILVYAAGLCCVLAAGAVPLLVDALGPRRVQS